LELASQFQFQLVATGRSIVDQLIENNWLLNIIIYVSGWLPLLPRYNNVLQIVLAP
jgi:hypothetical protein